MVMKIESLAGDGKGYGSGPYNPHGPRFEFEVNEHETLIRVNFTDEFQGWPGMVHNGLLMLGLDDSMFFAVVAATGSYSMSVELKLCLLNPAPINEDLIFCAWVSDINGRKVTAEGEIRRQQDKTLLARGQALFILVKGREEAGADENLARASLPAANKK